MSLSRVEKVEMYESLKQLKEDHMIDDRTYGMMLNALGISEGPKKVVLYEGNIEVELTV
jgi:hypothetical protein